MFTFPIDPHALFAERRRQFAGWGIPEKTIQRVQSRIKDNWTEGPGGWSYEWWQVANAAEEAGNFLLASMLYGAARFPVAVTPMRQRALQCQVRCFERAADHLPIYFKRIQLFPTSANGHSIPVHFYAPSTDSSHPFVLLSGGVDTGKTELHRLAYLLARLGRFRVAAIDMPGTGESKVPLAPDSDRIYHDILSELAPTGRKALLGISFGGHWAAKLALQGVVDAAINLGGPITIFEAGKDFANKLPNGMAGIIANACGLTAMPNEMDIDKIIRPFSLQRQGLLEKSTCAPMLVINGEHDQYIPQHETTLLGMYPDNKIWLMRRMTHCAAEGLPFIFPAMVAWLRIHLQGETISSKYILKLAEYLLPARVTDWSL